jgi:hypothetical protein
MTKIIQAQKPVRWSLWEYCLLNYVEKTASDDGTFQQTAAKIAETIEAEERCIQRHLRDLHAKGHLIEVTPRHRDANGWWIPAIYRLTNPATISPATNDTGRQRQTAQVASDSLDGSPQRQTAQVVSDSPAQPNVINNQPATNVALETLLQGTELNGSVSNGSVLNSTGLNSSVNKMSLDAPAPAPARVLSADDIFSREYDAQQAAKQKAIEEAKKDTTPYRPGQTNIPKEVFIRSRVPMCIECGVETVDFWDDGESIDLEHFCDEETCGELWETKKQDRLEQQARERKEKQS